MPRRIWEWNEHPPAEIERLARQRARHVVAILGAAAVAGVVLGGLILAVYSLGPNIMP
jgi:hypothetical protein